MPGCNECKHKQNSLGDFVDDKFEMIYDCPINKAGTIEWWNLNGHVKPGQPLTDMECHEYSDITNCLIHMNTLASQLLVEIKKINNEK